MYIIENKGADAFEFEWEGTAYSVPRMASLPMDDLMAFADAAAAGGESEALRWAYRFFNDATGGAAGRMPGAAFGQLVKAWQAPVDVGK